MAANPLTKQDVEAIRKAKKDLKRAVNLIESCKRCNIDVEKQEEICMFLADQYGKLCEEFGIQEREGV